MPKSREPVRIAFCITDLDAGGAERALVQVVTGLDRARWEPFVFALSREGELAGVLRAHGIMVTCLGADKRLAPGALWTLSRRLAKLRPSLLQTFLHHANIVGRLAGRTAGVKHIVSGIRVAEKRSRSRLWLDRATEWMVARHVCVSEDVASFSIREGRLPAAKVVVIPNGVDYSRFADAAPANLADFGIPPSSRTVLFVGRLDPQKGPFLLLLAAKDLFDVHPALHLLLVGAGGLESSLRAWVCRQGLESRIHFAGRRNDVPALLRAASLFVLPSAWEGLPNVVLEAMAAGTPVIATHVEGVSALLDDGRSGLVVPANSPSELRAAISVLLGDPELARRLARCAQKIAEERFRWPAVVDQYDALYGQILGLDG